MLLNLYIIPLTLTGLGIVLAAPVKTNEQVANPGPTVEQDKVIDPAILPELEPRDVDITPAAPEEVKEAADTEPEGVPLVAREEPVLTNDNVPEDTPGLAPRDEQPAEVQEELPDLVPRAEEPAEADTKDEAIAPPVLEKRWGNDHNGNNYHPNNYHGNNYHGNDYHGKTLNGRPLSAYHITNQDRAKYYGNRDKSDHGHCGANCEHSMASFQSRNSRKNQAAYAHIKNGYHPDNDQHNSYHPQQHNQYSGYGHH